MLSKIITWFIFSQIFFLGVFALPEDTYIVLEKNENLCWEFMKWTSEKPNWLSSWWEALFLNEKLYESSFQKLDCAGDDVWKCCKALWYRFAGVPIWVSNISEERSAAESLARRWYIEKNSFSPDKYNLEANISRKELMKIIMWVSWATINDFCREIFTDVKNDWGCKYIETALDEWFIEWNQAFRPEAFVTKTEALKLIFKARDITKRYNTGYWQQDYVSTAYYLGYIDEKFSNFNTYITRGEIFQIIDRTY